MKKNTGKMRQKKLTKRQKQIIEYLRTINRKRGYPPSIREICDHLNLSSSSTVHNHLCNLESKGYIKREPSKPRSIKIVKSKKKIKDIELEKLKSIITTTSNNLKSYPKTKSNSRMSVFLSEIEDEQIASFIVSGEEFSGFGIGEDDVLLIKSPENLKKNDLLLIRHNEKGIITGYYQEKNKRSHLISTGNETLDVSKDNLIARVLCILKN